MLKRFNLNLFLCTVLCVSQALPALAGETEQAATRLLNAVHAAGKMDIAASCAPEVPEVKTEEYVCEAPAETIPAATATPVSNSGAGEANSASDKAWELSVIHGNDDFFFDAIKPNLRNGKWMPGNDTGMTSEFLLSLSKKLKDHSVIRFEIDGKLYEMYQTAGDAQTKKAESMKAAGLISKIIIEPTYRPTNFVDAARFEGFYVHPLGDAKSNYTYTLGAGLEKRVVEPGSNGSLPLDAGIQNFVHKFGMHPDTYDPASGVRGEVVTQGTDAHVFPDYPSDPRFAALAPYSVIVDLGLARETKLLNTQCRLKTEVGAHLSTERNLAVGSNSNVSAGASLSSILFQRQNGQPRLQFDFGDKIYYFKDNGVGSDLTATAKTSVGMGKRGSSVDFIIRVHSPKGAQSFQFTDDHDLIQDLGVVFHFGK